MFGQVVEGDVCLNPTDVWWICIGRAQRGDGDPMDTRGRRIRRGEAILESPSLMRHDWEHRPPFISTGRTGIASPLPG